MGRIGTQQVSLGKDGQDKDIIVTLRNPRIEDAEGLLDYVPRMLSETPFLSMEPSEFQMTVEQERAWIQRHLDCPGSVAVLAEINGQIVGTSGLDRSRKQRFAHTAVLGISILQQYCGRGLGRAMMNALIDFAERSEVLEKVKLEVFSHNLRAIRLYESVGFVEEGRSVRSVRFADGHYADDIHMARFVKPVETCGSFESSKDGQSKAPRKGVRS
jgi:RimJ/RimL family protein N-acetyltransferase